MVRSLVVSFVFAMISLGLGIYCYQWASPSVASYTRILPEMEANSKLYETTLSYWKEAVEKEQTLSLISMIAGAIGLLGGTYCSAHWRRKKWLGLVVAIVALGGLLLGLNAGTHLFN